MTLRHALQCLAVACLVFATLVAARPFTARDLVSLDRLSDPQLAPDGSAIAYVVSHSLWFVRSLPGAPSGRLVSGASSPRWSHTGDAIYFLSNRSGSEQIWRTDRIGAHVVQVTHLPLDVEAYRLSPDGSRLVVALAVFPECPTLACTVNRKAAAAKSKASGTLYTHLFIRHWDTWADGTRNHLFSLALRGDAVTGTPVSLMRSFDGDSPSKPFGGDEEFAISPNGRTVVFTARLAGKSEPWSTNFDLYEVPIDGSSAPRDLTADNPAWDGDPAFSPDGTKLAYVAQKRQGFESDRYGIMVRDLRSGATREIDPAWDRSAGTLAWSSDGRWLYTAADDIQAHKLFAVDAASGAVKALTQAGDVESFTVGTNGIAFALSSLVSPAQLYLLRDGVTTQLTHVDAIKLRDVALTPSQTFTFAGWNGDTVHGRVTKPYGYQAGKKYPVAFLIHGGPQGSWTDGWSYRWNPQFYAGLGYAVVTVDFHGSTGYGQTFTDAISQHWGDRPLEDLQKGWSAALEQFPFLNGDRACALGASYGGYMIDWIAGNWNQPWKCLVVHDGVFDNRMMGYSTEELWFSEWENGGTPWDHPENYERFNPIDHVADWRVPMLVIHSSKDFRIPIEQGIGAFTALQRKGIPSEFLTFPDENHWVLKRQDSLQWHTVVADWLRRWL
jgi:dipeptidyl aminopeptidase/acylaminoacyl peptidase